MVPFIPAIICYTIYVEKHLISTNSLRYEQFHSNPGDYALTLNHNMEFLF